MATVYKVMEGREWWTVRQRQKDGETKGDIDRERQPDKVTESERWVYKSVHMKKTKMSA